MARIAYPSDLTNAQWRLLAQRIPPAKPGGRHRTVNLREVVNGILYAVGGWDGGYHDTVYAYDPATNTWTTKAPMPTPKRTLVGVVNGLL